MRWSEHAGGENFRREIAQIAVMHQPFREPVRILSRYILKSAKQGRAADVGGALIAQRKDMAGKISCPKDQVAVVKRAEIARQQCRLFKSFAGLTDRFSSLRKRRKRSASARLRI
jgi:hypothetical protein